MQSVERVFAVLRALAGRDSSTGVSEIARITGLAKSTTSRILASLEDLQMVERIDERFVLGPGLATLTAAAAPASSVKEIARPYLRELAEASGETVSLALPDGDEIIYVDTAQAPGAVHVRNWTGMRFPMHTVAAGLALLISRSAAELVDYAAGGMQAFTELTITDHDDLRARVAKVRRAGVAWTIEEFDEDVNGVAVPVIDSSGVAIAAINISGPSYRFPGDAEPEALEALLTSACRQISARL